MIGLGIALLVGVLIGIGTIGLLSGAKTNDLLDEIDRLNKELYYKEQEYCRLVTNYNQLKEFNDNTDRILTKVIVGGSK